MLTGLSSASAPDLTGRRLAALVRQSGGGTVDLRYGRGHRWEETGLRPFGTAGVDVAFVGVDITLGKDGADRADGADEARARVRDVLRDAPLAPGVPVKVFADPDCLAPERRGTTLAQVTALADRLGGPGDVLVETHQGGASPTQLAALHAETGVRILVDTLGLARISSDPLDAATRLAPSVTVAQVKGFDWSAPRHTRHLPLATGAGPTRALLAGLPRLARVTVETRAESAAEDLRLLTAWWQH